MDMEKMDDQHEQWKLQRRFYYSFAMYPRFCQILFKNMTTLRPNLSIICKSTLIRIRIFLWFQVSAQSNKTCETNTPIQDRLFGGSYGLEGAIMFDDASKKLSKNVNFFPKYVFFFNITFEPKRILKFCFQIQKEERLLFNS